MKDRIAGCMFRAGLHALAVMMATAGAAWAQVEVPALSYDMVHTSYTASEAPQVATRERHAVRRDGSRVTIRTMQAPDGTTYELRRVTDLVRMRMVQVDTNVRTVTSLPVPGMQVDWIRNGPWRSCEAPQNATRVEVGEYYALRFSRTIDTTPGAEGGELQIEQLVAPQLGCTVLLTVFRRDGRLTSTQAVENLRLGDPDPALFIVPPNYREASPGEVLRLKGMGPSGLPGDATEMFLRLAEENYRDLRRSMPE